MEVLVVAEVEKMEVEDEVSGCRLRCGYGWGGVFK